MCFTLLYTHDNQWASAHIDDKKRKTDKARFFFDDGLKNTHAHNIYFFDVACDGRDGANEKDGKVQV